jgi:hypothetical protein
MRKLALLLAIPGALAYAQAEQTADQTASPELVGQVAKVVGITPAQAQSAAGTLFGAAKTKLSAEDFAKVAGSVPNMDGLLKAAAPPASGGKSALDQLAGKAGGVSTALAVAGTLSKLGLKPDQIAKLTPALVKFVQSKGGKEIASLLAGALK